MKWLVPVILLCFALPVHAASSYENRINDVRYRHGLLRVKISPCLRQQGLIRAKYISERGASHAWADGLMFSQHGGYCGSTMRFENVIYWTEPRINQLQQNGGLSWWISYLWINSPAHKKVMLSPYMKKMAIVIYKDVIVLEGAN